MPIYAGKYAICALRWNMRKWGNIGNKRKSHIHIKLTVTRQRRGCDLNPGPSAPESSTLTTRLPSHPDHDLFCKLCAPTHALNHLLPPTRTVPVWELEGIHTSCQTILLIFIRNLFSSVLYIALSSEIVLYSFFLVLLLCTVRHSDSAFCVRCLMWVCRI